MVQGGFTRRRAQFSSHVRTDGIRRVAFVLPPPVSGASGRFLCQSSAQSRSSMKIPP